MHAQEQNLSTLAIYVIGRVTSSIPERGTFTNGTSLHVLRLHEGLIRMPGDEDMGLFFAGEIAEDRQRIAALENKIESLTQLLTGDVNETTKRAMRLKDIVNIKGLVTRRQVQNELGNCHHNIAHKAMEKAAELYGYIHTKNDSGKWVLSMN